MRGVFWEETGDVGRGAEEFRCECPRTAGPEKFLHGKEGKKKRAHPPGGIK